MREVKVITWCDVCAMDGDARVAATHTYTVGLVSGENKPALKVLEVCERHDKLATELAAIMATIGQPPALPKAAQLELTPAPTGPPRWECPVCHQTIARTSSVTHVWSAHRRDVRPPYPTKCPDCGRQEPSGQAMASHRRSAHGYDALADALSGVDR